MKGSDLSVLHSWHFYIPVFSSTRGPVLKLTMLHCSSGKMNGLVEMSDPELILYKRQQVYSPWSIMNLDSLAERARRPSWNSPLPATFFTLKMVSMDSLTQKTSVKTPNSSLQDRCRWSCIECKGAAAILDAILNYTFLPHTWNVYPSFQKSPMGPLQGSRVKIRGHDCTRNPLQPPDYVILR